MKRYIGTCLPHAGRYMQSRTGAVTQVSILPQSFFCYCRIIFCYCRIIFLQTAMKRSPHPAGRALRTQRKFVALAWSRVTPHPPALRVTRQHILPVRYVQFERFVSKSHCRRRNSSAGLFIIIIIILLVRVGINLHKAGI